MTEDDVPMATRYSPVIAKHSDFMCSAQLRTDIQGQWVDWDDYLLLRHAYDRLNQDDPERP